MALTKLKGFYQPSTLREAAGLLHKHADNALIIGGGTFIHGLVARGLINDVEYLVDLSSLGLNDIDVSKKLVSFGASTTFAEIEANKLICESILLGSINDAIAYPPPQIKHAATIGGCVAASCPFLDLPISLLALDASAVVMGRFFKRKIKFEDLFVSLFGHSMKSGEFIANIILPHPELPTASAFQKLETNANDLAILNCAVRISIDNGLCVDARVFIGGGVGETPFRSLEVEQALNNRPLSMEVFSNAASLVNESFDPLSDHRASSDYRKAMAGVFVKRCLVKVAERLGVEL